MASAIADIESRNIEEDIHPVNIEKQIEDIAFPDEKRITGDTGKGKETQIDNKRLSTKEHVREFFSETPEMINVAHCESNFRQYDENGLALRGNMNSSDIGVMQINEIYHGDRAKELGMDIYTKEGNLEYAMYLYKNQGLAPWGASRHCWENMNSNEIAIK